MKKIWPPQDQVLWYLKQDNSSKTLRENQTVDVAIVGGGIAGLAAAQAFHKRGKKTVVLEQYYCGSGASGKSSGFVTPNAELSFTDFSKRYNKKSAREIWGFITSGVNDIRTNIHHYSFACDYSAQDTLMVTDNAKDLSILKTEYHNLIDNNYKTEFHADKTVHNYIGSTDYCGGLLYKDSFSINGYAYCQEMKQYLKSQDVLIFEETPVTSLNNHTLITPYATITAEYIVVCVDHFLPNLGLLKQDVYHAQTFIMVSQQLTDDEIQLIFPQEKLLVWDTDLIYNYFRITSDNRLLIGGGSLLTTYASQETHNYKSIVTKLSNYIHKKFPKLSFHWEYMWPGLIGISKDIGPIAGPDEKNKHIYYVTAATGLPIAAALGRYSAQHLIDGDTALDAYFSPYRPFPIGGILQSMLGTKVSFALSNFLKHNIP